jgi:subtilisin family serine protease
MNQKSKVARASRLSALILLLVLLGLLNAGVLSAGDDDDDDDAINIVPHQIVVKLAPGAKIKAINRTYGTTTVDTLAAGYNTYLLEAAESADMEALLERMDDDRRIIYAEPNFYLQQPEIDRRSAWAWGGEDTTPYAEQYARELINLEQAHVLSQGNGVVVAVVDTGVQLNHPVLSGRLTSARRDFIDGDRVPNDDANGIDDDQDGEVDEGTGHGTHVAGIVHLVAPGARIMPLRALDSDGRGDAFAIAEAILFALKNGATVINLSLGMSEESELLEEATEDAAEQGVLVVAAAGNLNSDQPQYPAASECVLAITAVGPAKVRSPFANYGSWIALAAPGESIYSPFPTNGFAWWSGTSMATPFAAGQAALLRGYAPSLSLLEMAAYMGGTAQSLDAANPNFQGKLGAGLIDAQASLLALAQGRPPGSSELLDDDCTDVDDDDD